MDDNVIKFPGFEEDDNLLGEETEVDMVLNGIKDRNLTDIIILGRDSFNTLYFATTSGNPKSIMWDLESAKYILLKSTFGSEGE